MSDEIVLYPTNRKVNDAGEVLIPNLNALEQRVKELETNLFGATATVASLEAKLAEAERERDEAMALVTEANNSLYGSQGYFHSLNGGPFDRFHLAKGIEKLKSACRRAYEQQERLCEALRKEWR